MSDLERVPFARLDREAIDGAIDRFGELRLLVTGDMVLDEYLWGEVDRVSPEAPVPVVHVGRESVVLGGAGNVARGVVALGASCSLCAVVGDDADGRTARSLLKELGVETNGLIEEPGRPSTRKTRVVARGQQVVRFDRETREPLARATADALEAAVKSDLASSDGVILADYAKGVFGGPSGERLVEAIRDARKPFFADPKQEVAIFLGASLVKPNQREAQRLAGVGNGGGLESPVLAAKRIAARLEGSDVVVTRGGGGIMVLAPGEDPLAVPTPRREVYDVQGAGDTAMVALAMARLVGLSLREAAVVANAAAGVVVGKSGTATASGTELREFLPAAIQAAAEASEIS